MRSIAVRLVILVLMLVLSRPFEALAKTEHFVYFDNTDYELHVYKISGIEKGKRLMIMGGIQGDEPGGYLAADLYADIALRKGDLTVVPRSNFLSIIKHKREINGDMNRRFSRKSKEYYEDRVVEILKGLMAESDYFLNLHEGSGFYSDERKSELVNPDRYGQSIIADTDIFKTEDGGLLELGKIARSVIEGVNASIEDKGHYFHFNNHRTFERDSSHTEQRGSATFFALSTYNIPAFGVETSKEIKDIEAKVRYHTLVINGFMDEFGIIRENPKIALDPPKFNYMIVSVNDGETVLHNGEELKIRRGDRVKVVDVDANFKRGLSVDLVGVGTANDLKKEFILEDPLAVLVKKDGFTCGEIRVAVDDNSNTVKYPISSSSRLKYLVIERNGEKMALKNEETATIVRGDILRLADAMVDRALSNEIKVNFVGFVGDAANNTGDDRGYTINTARDLWVKYSEEMKGKNYKIDITTKLNRKIGTVYLNIEEPVMDYLVLMQNGREKRCYSSGEVVAVNPGETLAIADLKTNVSRNAGVKLYIDGYGDKGEKTLNIGDVILDDPSYNLSSTGFRLSVKREGLLMGQTTINVNIPVASTAPMF